MLCRWVCFANQVWSPEFRPWGKWMKALLITWTMKTSRPMMWLIWWSSSSEIYPNLYSPTSWGRHSSTSTSVSIRIFEDSYTFDALWRLFIRAYLSKILPLTCADVPKDQRLQAVQAAIMLMSDENREVLQTLLCFLSDVTSSVEENQMTPMNIAVCLAPSLFHLNLLKKDNLSPK